MTTTLDSFLEQLQNYGGWWGGVDTTIPEGLAAQDILESLCAAYAPWFDKEKKHLPLIVGGQSNAENALGFLKKIELVTVTSQDNKNVYYPTAKGIDFIPRVMDIPQLLEYAAKYQTKPTSGSK